MARLYDTAASRSLNVLDASTLTGRTTIALPPIASDDGVDDLCVPDPHLHAVLDQFPPPLSRTAGQVIAVAAIAAEPVARISLKLARLAQARGSMTVVVDGKVGERPDDVPIVNGTRPMAQTGLADHLLGTTPLDGIVRRTKAGGLAILTAGTSRLPRSSLLSSQRWPQTMRQLGETFETVVVIAPTVGSDGFADVARLADGILMVADGQIDADYLADRTDLVGNLSPKSALVVGLLRQCSGDYATRRPSR